MGHGCCAFFWRSAIRNLEPLELGLARIQDATGFAVRSFAELGLVLMITLAVNVIARMLVRNVSGTVLPSAGGSSNE